VRLGGGRGEAESTWAAAQRTALLLSFLPPWKAAVHAAGAGLAAGGAAAALADACARLALALRSPGAPPRLRTAGAEIVTLGRAGSLRAQMGLGAVTVMIASDEMAAAVKPSVHTQIMAQMNTLRTARNTRYALSDSGLNPVKWAFVCFTEIVAMLTVGFGHLERKRAQILAFALFFAASTPTLAVLVIESNPFRGFVPVSSHPIEVALDHSTGLLAKMPPKRPTGAE
jgi:hypothetical protein